MKRLGVLVAVLLAAAGCTSASPPAATPTADLSVKVRYDAKGTAAWASVTLASPTGTVQIEPDLPLQTKDGHKGLTYTFQLGDFVYMSVQNKEAYGSVTCRITRGDGVVVSENTSSGAYTIATCQGQA